MPAVDREPSRETTAILPVASGEMTAMTRTVRVYTEAPRPQVVAEVMLGQIRVMMDRAFRVRRGISLRARLAPVASADVSVVGADASGGDVVGVLYPVLTPTFLIWLLMRRL